MQFTVKVHVTGGMGLPSYDTSVNVDARDVQDAKELAVKELKRGVFYDRWLSNFVIKSVEWEE